MISFLTIYKNALKIRPEITNEFLEHMNAHLDMAQSLEAIICDYGSDDGIYKQIDKYYPNLTHVYVKPNKGQYLNMAKCLNAGCKAATNPVIAPFGVDMRVKPHTVQSICKVFYALKGIIFRPMMVKLKKDGSPENHYTYTPYLMFRNDVLKLGGWDERMVGWGREDDDLMERGMKYGGLMELRARALYFGYIHKWHDTFFIDQTDNRNYDDNPNSKFARENAESNGKNLVNSYWIRAN